MIVKIIRGCLDLGFGYMGGSNKDLPDDQAKFLIKHGRAVPVPQKEIKEPEVKTAVVDEVEVRPVRKPRKRTTKKDEV